MVRNYTMILAMVIFGALVFGGFLVATDQSIPVVTQVTNPEASALEATDSQLATLALVVIGVIVVTGGMGTGLAVTFWFLNREVKRAEEQEVRPFEFTLKPEGNSIGSVIQQNTFIVAFTIGIVFLALFVALLLFTGALS